MFVLTLNKKKGRKIAVRALGVVFLLGVVAGVRSFLFKGQETAARVKPNLKMSTTRDMARYIREKGYTVDLQSRSVSEVRIPKKFDAEFENFNEKIRRTDNLSLDKYKNDKVNKWTFDITDYGVENKGAVAVLLVKKEKLIGAYLLQTPEGIAFPLAKSATEGDRLN